MLNTLAHIDIPIGETIGLVYTRVRVCTRIVRLFRDCYHCGESSNSQYIDDIRGAFSSIHTLWDALL